MRPPKIRAVDLVVLGFILVLVGCNEGPAEEALAEAEAALDGARADLERYAPEDLARLTGDLDAASGALAEGRYTDALRQAQDLPERIHMAANRAAARREVLEAAWDELARTVPDRLDHLQACLRQVASGPPPAGDEPWVRGAGVHLRDLEGRWAKASRAFERGLLSRALAEGRAVDTEIDEISGALDRAPGC